MHSYPGQYCQVDGIFFPKAVQDSNAFAYSDGEEFDKRIAAIIASASDRSLFSAELRNAIWDWRSSCHLSPVRANILRPLEKVCGGRVLELGAGCGIITRYLGELGSDVVALEASPFRAGVTRLRTADLENVKVVCDRIEEFEAAKKFDVVTMIGVLQYARLFSSGGNRAEVSLIENAMRQLRADGILIIAIQNKLGLKYFAGDPESNAELPYFGIEGRYGSVARFGVRELKEMLAAAGLKHQAILLPVPDYHMPITILNEKALEQKVRFSVAPFLSAGVGRDRARSDWRRPTFAMEKVWEYIDAAGLTLGLSNAFLVVAGKSKRSLAFYREMNEFAWHYSVDRHSSFAIAKRFIEADGEVAVESHRLNSKPSGITFVTQHLGREAYVKGRLWWAGLVDIVNRPGWSAAEVGEWARPWIGALCTAGGLSPSSAGFPRLDGMLPGVLFDFTPMNCIQSLDGAFTFIDKEWEIHSTLKLSHLIIRGLFGSLVSISSCARPAAGTPLHVVSLLKMATTSIDLDIADDCIDDFIAREGQIQSFIRRGFEGDAEFSWSTYVKSVLLDCRHVDLGEIARVTAELNAEKANVELEVIRLQDELHTAKANLELEGSRLQEELNTARAYLKSEQENTRLVTSEVHRLQEELNTTKSDLKSEQENTRLVTSEVHRLQEELNTTKADLESEQAKTRYVASEAARLLEELNTAKADLKTEQENSRRVTSDVTRLQEELNTARADLQSEQKRTRHAAFEAIRLQEGLNTAKTDLESEQARTRHVASEATRLQEELNNAKANLDSQQAHTRHVASEAARLQEELNTAKAKDWYHEVRANALEAEVIASRAATVWSRIGASLRRTSKDRERPLDADRDFLVRLIEASGLFDAEFYRAHNPDVVASGSDPLGHYLEYGGTEGRAASRVFDSRWYLATNPDVARAGMNPLVHFLRHGIMEGRKLSGSIEPLPGPRKVGL